MTSLMRSIALTLVLVALLTWLLFQSGGPAEKDYLIAKHEFDRVGIGEIWLRRDVLEARAGLLRTYDPLVADINRLHSSAARASIHPRFRPSDRPFVEQLHVVIDAEDAALERFKTDNALLQNSLSSFNMLDPQIVESNADPSIVGAVAGLGNAVLSLSRSTTQANQDRVSRQLAAIAILNRRTTNDPAHDQVNLLAVHGRLLSQLLPAVDRDVQTLFGVSTFRPLVAIHAGQDARERAEQVVASRYRLSLYLVAIILSAVLVRIGLQWLSGLRVLRYRAEAESVIADISTAFISAPFEDYESMFERALARLGKAFGADQAMLHLAGAPAPAHRWSRTGAGLPAGSPDDILAASLSMTRSGSGDMLVDVGDVAALPDGPLRASLRAAGAGSWCGIVLRDDARRGGLLGFARDRPSPDWPHGGAALVRAASEIIQNALQRRKSSEERLELEGRLSRARRLEALGTFASGIAHNFNNVVGVILGYTEMAVSLAEHDPDATSHLKEIRSAGERAQELISRILEFGTYHGGQQRIVSVDGLISDSVSMLDVMLPPSVHLSVQCETPNQMVHGDAAQLQQVLINLVRNAQQAMPHGGTITVSFGHDEVTQERPLSHDVLRPGIYVRLRVADTGSGMNGAMLAKIFEPFFTSRPAGTGLGLATIRQIVDDHQGVIDVQSTLNRGSVFTVWLHAAVSCPAAPAQSARGSGEIVLICSTDPAILVRDEETLAALGYEPIGFRSVQGALSAVRSAPDGFDAMMLDVGEVDRDTLQGLAELRQAFPARNMVVIGRATSTVSRDELAVLGIDSILQRPFRSSILAGALARRLA